MELDNVIRKKKFKLKKKDICNFWNAIYFIYLLSKHYIKDSKKIFLDFGIRSLIIPKKSSKCIRESEIQN